MKIQVLVTVSVLAGCLLWSPFSNADSLIIQFSSGKTQHITLEEPLDTVATIQSQTTGTESREAAQNVLSRELYSRKAADARVDKTKSYSLKWGAPKFGE